MEASMETLMGLAVGVGLSAACGFRIFIPLLGLSIASTTGHMELTSGFEWVGTRTALIAFSAATLVEMGAYFIPWIDNALDTIATPTAMVAGTVMTATLMGDISPFLKWSLAIIAGGGVAGIVQGGTVSLRGASSTTTGGAGNFIVSIGELILAIGTTILAFVLPFVCLILVVVICFNMTRALFRGLRKRLARKPATARG